LQTKVDTTVVDYPKDIFKSYCRKKIKLLVSITNDIYSNLLSVYLLQAS